MSACYVEDELWGLQIAPHKTYSQTVEMPFRIHMAALREFNSEKRSLVILRVDDTTEYVLCSLTPGKLEQQPLSHTFVSGEKITFFTDGENAIHLTGNFLSYVDAYGGEEGSSCDLGLSGDDSDCLTGDEEDEEIDSDMADFIDDDEDEGEEPAGKIVELGSEKEKPKSPKKVAFVKEDSDSGDGDLEEVDELSEDFEFDDSEDEDLGSEEEDDDDPEGEEDEGLDSSDDEEEEMTLKESLKRIIPQQPAAASKKPKVVEAEKKPFQTSQPTLKKETPAQAQTPKKEPVSTPSKPQQPPKQPDTPKQAQAAPHKTSETPKPATPVAKSAPSQPAKGGEAQKETPKQQQQPSQNNSSVKKLPSGVEIKELKAGNAEKKARKGSKVSIVYKGTLSNGKVFDSNTDKTPFKFQLGAGTVIKGFDIGVEGMSLNSTRVVKVPASLAYGSQKLPGIPPNSDLTFEITLVDLK